MRIGFLIRGPEASCLREMPFRRRREMQGHQLIRHLNLPFSIEDKTIGNTVVIHTEFHTVPTCETYGQQLRLIAGHRIFDGHHIL